VLSFTPHGIQPAAITSRGKRRQRDARLPDRLPALLAAPGRTTLTLEVARTNAWAPPYDFLEKAFLRCCADGPRVTAKLERRGFISAGGRLRSTCSPPNVQAVQLPSAGRISRAARPPSFRS